MVYYSEDNSPVTFYIIRVTSKPPYVVIRLAFLVGAPGHLRHEAVSTLKEKVANLSFPQRLKAPPKWRVTNADSSNIVEDKNAKTSWSDMSCCVLLKKPVEKILIRYNSMLKINFNRTNS